jgi:hypothetical protein
MHDIEDPNDRSVTESHSAEEKADNRRENDAKEREEQSWDNEGGHMSSTAGCVTRVSGADLPYVVVLSHHQSETTEHSFATMREAEAFIRRNTPVPGRTLSALYDRPASEA